MTITLAGTTTLCKAWSFTEGFEPSVATQMGLEPEAPVKNRKKWSVLFDKPDSPVLSTQMIVRGAMSIQRGSISFGQAMSRWKIGKNHGNPMG
jgi:hypothetical protein